MRRGELKDGYAEWLSRFAWDWFCTLTFRGYPSRSKANKCFHRWISELRVAQGTENFRWFRVTEYGCTGENVHFHLLVGGLRWKSINRWAFRWSVLAGEPDISPFKRDRGAIQYIIKGVLPHRHFEIDFHLLPEIRKRG